MGEFESKLETLVAALKERSDVLLITPNTRGDALQEDGTTTEYVRSIRAVARRNNIGLADVYAVYQGAIRMGAGSCVRRG